MGVPYDWCLGRVLPKESVLEFVLSVPNAGLTEKIDGAWVDVYRSETGGVTVEPADVAAFVAELEKGRGGTLSYDVAAATGLAKCICVEVPSDARRKLGEGARFGEYRCHDLAETIARIEGMLDDGFDDGDDGAMLGTLAGSLARALELHVAVVFGE